jgi:hypothetical protein
LRGEFSKVRREGHVEGGLRGEFNKVRREGEVEGGLEVGSTRCGGGAREGGGDVDKD